MSTLLLVILFLVVVAAVSGLIFWLDTLGKRSWREAEGPDWLFR